MVGWLNRQLYIQLATERNTPADILMIYSVGKHPTAAAATEHPTQKATEFSFVSVCRSDGRLQSDNWFDQSMCKNTKATTWHCVRDCCEQVVGTGHPGQADAQQQLHACNRKHQAPPTAQTDNMLKKAGPVIKPHATAQRGARIARVWLAKEILATLTAFSL
jgi:hypothetical protein